MTRLSAQTAPAALQWFLFMDSGCCRVAGSAGPPWAIAEASYKQQRHNAGVTEIAEIPNRGHALVNDSGWREVADTALRFINRLV